MDQTRLLGRDDLLRRVIGHLRHDRGVVISGVPWVGRTRVLREALAKAGVEYLLCRPTAAGRGIPFGGLGGLAPSDPNAPGSWMPEMRDRIPSDTLVAVDGAQFLDAHSALLLFRAVDEGVFRVALSVWRGHPAPDAVTSLWTDGLVPLVEVDPLDQAATGELVAEALGGPVASATLQHIWDLSRGFPLLIRELLAGSRNAGILVERDGLWTGTGPLTTTASLADAARQVMGDLTEEACEGLELLALGEPIRPELMDALVAPETLELLERQQMAQLDAARGGYVLPAPGWALAIAAGLTAVRRRRLLGGLARAAPPLRELEGMELVRVACWRVEAGLGGEGEMLARAAHHAASHGVLDHARALAEAAIADAPIEGRLALADVMTRVDDPEGAVSLLEEVIRLGPAGRTGEAAVAAARIRFFRQGRRDEAIAALREAGPLHDPRARRLLDASEALLVCLRGDLPSAIDRAQDVLRESDARDRVALDASMAGALALTWHGRLTDGAALVRDALGFVRDVAGDTEEHMLELILEMAEHYAGRPRVALELGRDRYARALEHDAYGIAAVWATQMSGTMLSLGDVTGSLRLATEGVQLAEQDDELTVLPLACAWAAIACATGGDLAGARRWQDRMRAERQLEDARSRIMADRAAVAIRAGEADFEGTCDLAIAAARDAEVSHHLVWSLALLHDVVRVGRADLVLDDLHRVGARVDGPWAETVVRHAEVSAEGDLSGLERVADRFRRLGYTLASVEVLAEGARVASATGRASRAAVLLARARELRRQIPDAVTPALRGIGTEHLTRREREVALLAAEGLTSREVAERLVVSPRTVDNHLASVYRKLDIGGREDLSLALGTARPS